MLILAHNNMIVSALFLKYANKEITSAAINEISEHTREISHVADVKFLCHSGLANANSGLYTSVHKSQVAGGKFLCHSDLPTLILACTLVCRGK